jgi:excisionase family DNA binding protein
MNFERWLTTQQAADMLGLHRTTVLRLIDEGLLEARRYGQERQRPTIRIAEDDVLRFIDRSTEASSDR